MLTVNVARNKHHSGVSVGFAGGAVAVGPVQRVIRAADVGAEARGLPRAFLAHAWLPMR